MRKTILFVIFQQYADWEAAYISSAISMLGQGSYEIKTVSLSKDYVQSIGGFKVLPDYDVVSVPDDYGALILIGGMTWRSENTQPIKVLAKDCFQRGKLLGGICDSSAFLSTAGILNDIIHTINDLNDLKHYMLLMKKQSLIGTTFTNQVSILLQCLKCKILVGGKFTPQTVVNPTAFQKLCHFITPCSLFSVQHNR